MWNVQGLRKKLKELEAYLSKFDIIALTETWMEEKEINSTQWIPMEMDPSNTQERTRKGFRRTSVWNKRGDRVQKLPK